MKFGYCSNYIEENDVARFVKQMADRVKELEGENETLKSEKENLKAENYELRERLLDVEASL